MNEQTNKQTNKGTNECTKIENNGVGRPLLGLAKFLNGKTVLLINVKFLLEKYF